ncbi:MAG TPA: hypothetical protein VNT53_03755 [Pseudolysinimonas sp.]|nr:hypothetical protein [Pseudolysinimonas sp.]
MELVYVTVIGACIGALLRYLLPGHGLYGLALLPAVGAVVTATVWVGLLWLGWRFDGGWIWVVSLGAATIAAVLSATLLVRWRRTSDSRMLHHLSGGRA